MHSCSFLYYILFPNYATLNPHGQIDPSLSKVVKQAVPSWVLLEQSLLVLLKLLLNLKLITTKFWSNSNFRSQNTFREKKKKKKNGGGGKSLHFLK
jgi:hypothetical protein